MTTTTTRLDDFTFAARRLLAELWDDFETEPGESEPKPTAAAWYAAGLATAHSPQGGATDDRLLERLTGAFRELRDVADDGGRDGLIASAAVEAMRTEAELLAAIAEEPGDRRVDDAVALRSIALNVRLALAGFLVHRAGGLLDDAAALEAGAAELGAEGW